MMTLFPVDVGVRQAAEGVLAAGEVCAVEVERGGVLAVVEGIVWATREGDEEDHVLREGTVMHFERRGRVVVQALRGAARYKLR